MSLLGNCDVDSKIDRLKNNEQKLLDSLKSKAEEAARIGDLKLANDLKAQASSAQSIIDSIIAAITSSAKNAKSNLDNLLAKLKAIIAAAAKAAGVHSANAKAHNADKKTSDKHNMQDAKKDIKWTAMQHPDVKYTTLVKLNDARYSTSENYPTSKGWINEEKDFEKRNFTTGEWWRVHHTGYYQKVDGKGNYEQKIPGTELYYTFGDRGFVCAGNEDDLYMKNFYEHIMQEKLTVVDGNVTQNYNQAYFKNILLGEVRTIGIGRVTGIGANDILKIGGNLTIEVGGKINIKAGGPITINGAVINLN